jgi:hypothetical protein
MKGLSRVHGYAAVGVSTALVGSLFGACQTTTRDGPGGAGSTSVTTGTAGGQGGTVSTDSAGTTGSVGGAGGAGGAGSTGGVDGGTGGSIGSGGSTGVVGSGGSGGAGGAGGESTCSHAGSPGDTCASPCDCDVTLCPTYPMFVLPDCVNWGSGPACACTCIAGDNAACNSSCCQPVNGGAFHACAPADKCH